MKNLKELILRTADRHALDVSLQAAEIIAEALLAEIAKENAPFGWWHEGETEEESDFHLAESKAGEDCPTCLPLYTFPPSTEQIENRVAEACAKFLISEANHLAAGYGYDDLGGLSFGKGQHAEIKMDKYNELLTQAEIIRSGAWKEYLE